MYLYLDNSDEFSVGVKEAESVVPAVRHDHVAKTVHHDSSWIIKLSWPLSLGSKLVDVELHPGIIILLQDVNLGKSQVSDVVFPVSEGQESAPGVSHSDKYLRNVDISSLTLLRQNCS